MTTRSTRKLHDPKCGGKLRGKPGECSLPAGWGTTHLGFGRCKLHSGASPNGVKAAAKEAARVAVETYGLPREIDPHTALLEEVWRTAGAVAWLEQQVRQHEAGQLVWGVTRVSEKADGVEQVEEAKPSIWLVLYRQERKHLVEVCKVAIACGIAERQVKIAEEQGALIAQVIRGVLTDLGVDQDEPAVAKAVRSHLMLVAGGEG